MNKIKLAEIKTAWGRVPDDYKNCFYSVNARGELRYCKGGDVYNPTSGAQDMLIVTLGNNAAEIIADLEFAAKVREAVGELRRASKALSNHEVAEGEVWDEVLEAHCEAEGQLDRVLGGMYREAKGE